MSASFRDEHFAGEFSSPHPGARHMPGPAGRKAAGYPGKREELTAQLPSGDNGGATRETATYMSFLIPLRPTTTRLVFCSQSPKLDTHPNRN